MVIYSILNYQQVGLILVLIYNFMIRFFIFLRGGNIFLCRRRSFVITCHFSSEINLCDELLSAPL